MIREVTTTKNNHSNTFRDAGTCQALDMESIWNKNHIAKTHPRILDSVTADKILDGTLVEVM